MPIFKTPIAPQDMVSRIPRPGQPVDLAPYLEYLKEIHTNFGGEVELSPNEKKSTVKRRITTAAKQLGKEIRYVRSGTDQLIFQVVHEEAA